MITGEKGAWGCEEAEIMAAVCTYLFWPVVLSGIIIYHIVWDIICRGLIRVVIGRWMGALFLKAVRVTDKAIPTIKITTNHECNSQSNSQH
jgi:hypothetical protein